MDYNSSSSSSHPAALLALLHWLPAPPCHFILRNNKQGNIYVNICEYIQWDLEVKGFSANQTTSEVLKEIVTMMKCV